MSIDILITTDRIANDPASREFIAQLQTDYSSMGLDGAVVYYDFPSYADYETVTHKPDALVVSPQHGVVALRFLRTEDSAGGESLLVDESLAQFCSIAIGRFLKSRNLRKDLSTLKFKVTPVLYLDAPRVIEDALSSEVVTSLAAFNAILQAQSLPVLLTSEVVAEVRSVLEGAKALTRPQKRIIPADKRAKAVAALAQLEAAIANFDQKQRRAALVTAPGPQRIRGLAGSGKTVILAMKAAHLHLVNPEQQILVTFYTKSLRDTIKNLISKFFRHYKDEDPNWDRVHIRHGWGGKNSPGVYTDACRRAGSRPLTYTEARQQALGADPFDRVCRHLLSTGAVEPFYDQILIDEGQDFPSGFYELAFALARGSRDIKNIVWAYDELQNIMNVKIRSAEELFGSDLDGQPRVSLERAAGNLPPGATNDTILSKCYRNQREVLLVAHALGFGLYGNIVQLLESRAHWEDVGYSVESGNLDVGARVRILRAEENSAIQIPSTPDTPLIETFSAESADGEIQWAVEGIVGFLDQGLQSEDIVVIALDDYHAKQYFRSLSAKLADRGVASNNVIADPYSEPPFSIPGHITLSTVYRAKGNEAAVVFALGVDAIPLEKRSGRNRLFTAFTRTKAWLRVSGSMGSTEKILEEIATSRKNFPFLEFVMPDLTQVELIQRDISKKRAEAKRIRDRAVREMMDSGFSEKEIAQYLREASND